MLASLFWSTGSFYGRRITQPADPFVGAVIQMFTAGTVMTIVGVVLDGAGALDFTTASVHSLLALAYLAVAGAAAFSAYVWALRNLPISTVVSHQYVNPAVAVLLGAVLLGESLDASSIVGAALVIAAVFATVRSEASPSPCPRSSSRTERPAATRGRTRSGHDAPIVGAWLPATYAPRRSRAADHVRSNRPFLFLGLPGCRRLQARATGLALEAGWPRDRGRRPLATTSARSTRPRVEHVAALEVAAPAADRRRRLARISGTWWPSTSLTKARVSMVLSLAEEGHDPQHPRRHTRVRASGEERPDDAPADHQAHHRRGDAEDARDQERGLTRVRATSA